MKRTIKAALCVWGILVGSIVLAQDKAEVSRLMAEAGKCLLESKVDDARSLCAGILRGEANDAAKSRAALFLVMTFEENGSLRVEGCRTWAGKELPDEKARTLVEQTIEEYRRKFLAGAPTEDVRIATDRWRLGDPEPALPADHAEEANGNHNVQQSSGQAGEMSLGNYDIAAPLELPACMTKLPPEMASTINELTLAASKDFFSLRLDSNGTRNALHSSAPVSEAGQLEERIQDREYQELIRRGEELNLQGKHAEARRAFAKALVSEPKKDALSRAAMGIVLSFQGDNGLNVNSCKVWSKANIPTAEDRLRVGLAVGELYYRNQDYAQAIVHLEDVVKERGTVADMGSLVVALSLLGQGKRVEALAELNRVAAESSSQEIAAKAMFLVGWAHLQAQQYSAAKNAFDRLVSRYPESQFIEKATELSNRLKAYAE